MPVGNVSNKVIDAIKNFFLKLFKKKKNNEDVVVESSEAKEEIVEVEKEKDEEVGLTIEDNKEVDGL